MHCFATLSMRHVLLAVFLFATTLPAMGATPARTTQLCPAPASGHPPASWHDEYQWKALAEHGYHVGVVRIAIGPIYDLSKPGNDTWYAHLADALHITTRKQTIQNELLFRSGDLVSAPRIYQSERALRKLRFLQQVTITPGTCHGNQVDVDVKVKDTWSLKPEISYHRLGGQNVVKYELEEENLFGLGKTIAIGHLHDLDRNANFIKYIDPALGGSHWQLNARLAELTHGHSHTLWLRKPYFSDTAPFSAGVRILDQRARIHFYNDGKRAWGALDKTQQLSLYWSYLLHWNGDSGWRMGAKYSNRSYTYDDLKALAPALKPRPFLHNRRYSGLQATLSYFQDHYATFHDLKLINRAEDYNLGWNATIAFGYFPTALGSSSNAWIGGLTASYGMRLPHQGLLFFKGELGGRHTQGAWRGSHAEVNLTYYNQTFANQTLVAHVDGTWHLRADPENQLYLGNISGLRGYDAHFRTGDRRWQLTLEDRFLTATYFLNTFRLGYTAYFDAGQIHPLDGSGWSPVFSDIGGGLRIGTTRFSFSNVIYITIAFPLVRPAGVSSYQLFLGNVVRF